MKLNWSDVTPEGVFLNRRAFMAASGAFVAAPAWAKEQVTPYDAVTTYNNFYEFGTGKGDPAANSGAFNPQPWSVTVDGMVDRAGQYDLGDLIPSSEVEERIYRFRCVEAWAMVVPWLGVSLAKVLDRVGVQPGAKFVAFETVMRPEEMPGQRTGLLNWPYREGLRLDEAMHPLTILATGMYGKPMPNQNGAPVRLVVPWKYGFKSIKSIVRITLTDKQPRTTWQSLQSSEYGFYANVNPHVDHPRWSQASERVLGAGLFGGRQDTRMFNGYDEVAPLYAGMDLAKHY